MYLKIEGNEGEYLVKNESSILQYKCDEHGNKTGESVLHIITDSIENQEDRNEVTRKIVEYNLN